MNLELKNCALCGAEALLYSVGEFGRVSADYDCDCGRLRPTEYAAAYTRDYYIRRRYLDFMTQLDPKHRRYFAETLQPNTQNVKALKIADEFAPPKFFYLHGHAGIGKTHIAVTAARSVILQGLSVRFISEEDLLNERRGQLFGDTEVTPLPHALLLDDIAKSGKPSEFYAKIVHDILEKCDRGDRGLIITSNHTPEEAAERIALDPANREAIVSRFRAGVVLELKGKDQRVGSKA